MQYKEISGKKGTPMSKTVDYILEVAKCGGITKAANNLYITPSALSKFVQSKEEELQVKLFNRNGKKFVLAYAGERYIEMLKQVLELQQKMDSEMGRIASMYMGRLRIGFQISLADSVLSKVIPEFQKMYTNIQIMLEENSSVELVRLLKKKELDIVVTTTDYTDDSLDCKTLSEGQIVIAVPNDSPFIGMAQKKDGFKYPWIDFHLCAKERVVALSPGQTLRTTTNQVYASYKLEPDFNVIVKTTRTALLCVANHMGMTITQDLLVYQNHFEDKMTLLSFGETPVVSHFVILSEKGSVLHAEVEAFTEICKRYF